MPLVLIAEDDFGTRKLLAVILERSGYRVLQAVNGLEAWDKVRENRPDVIVSDINMPGLTGIELLRQVREDALLAATPLILITSLQERRDVRQGMNMGADDYIGKPVAPDELLAAVAAQVNRNSTRAAAQEIQVKEAVIQALRDQAQKLGDRFERRLADALNEQWPGSRNSQSSNVFEDASVVCVRLQSVQAWAHILSPGALALVMRRFHECVGDSVFLFGASHLQGGGAQLLAVFADDPEQPKVPHALRAYRAAVALRQSEITLGAFATGLLDDRARTDLPTARIDIGMHCGAVAMAQLQGLLGGQTQSVPVGLVILEAEDLARQGTLPPYRVAVSPAMMRRITGAARLVERRLLAMEGRLEPLDSCVVEPAT